MTKFFELLFGATKCSTEGCKQIATKSGFCPYCYHNWTVSNETLNEKQARADKGQPAIINGDKIRKS